MRWKPKFTRDGDSPRTAQTAVASERTVTARAGRAARVAAEIFRRVSPYVRWLRTPLGSLVLAAAASGLCGVFLHPQGFVVCTGVLTVTAVGLLWPWLSVRGLSGSLAFDRGRCREGETIALRLTVRNRIPSSVWGVSIQGGPDEVAGEELDADVFGGIAVVPGLRTTSSTMRFTPHCRGLYPRTPPLLACGFPFGLHVAARPLELTAPLLVWPRTFPVAPLPDGRGGHASEGLAVRDRAGNWGDPMGVRPYRRGYPLRRVHWGKTARHGELIVCEVQSNAVPRVQIVLDTHPSAHAGTGPDGSREWAVRVAASFAEGWAGQGAEVELVVDGAVEPPGRSARTRTEALLDALARLVPRGEQDLSALLDRPECREFERGLRVIVTTDVGVRHLSATRLPRRSDRFVVLHARGFAASARDELPAPLPVLPWVWINGPEQVATSLRRAGKEAPVGR